MLDLSLYPPAPVIWAYTSIDLVCNIIGYTNWRQSNLIPSSWTEPKGAWLSEEFRINDLYPALPPMLSYLDFLKENENYKSFSFDSIMTYAFHTPSTALADLSRLEAIVVLIAIVVILRQVKSILIPFFSSLGKKAARATHGPDWEASNGIRIHKFGEYVFRLVFHSTISIAGIIYFWDKEWWKSGGTKSLWIDYPFQEVEPGMIWYYLVQSAYNLEAFLSLMELSFSITFSMPKKSKTTSTWQFPIRIEWSPTVRGDFREMCVHHVITNLLVVGSSFFRLTRVGSMVFLVHDISDVPVDLSKLANFLKWKVTTSVCFASMCLVWMATRLGVLPFTIYWSILNEGWEVTTTKIVTPIQYICYRRFFDVLVGLLILLHMAWFTMFIKMGYVLIRKGEAHDYSEHKTGEKPKSSGSSISSSSTTTTNDKEKTQ